MVSAIAFHTSVTPRTIHKSENVEDMNVAFHSFSTVDSETRPSVLSVPDTHSLIPSLGGSFSLSTEIAPIQQLSKHDLKNREQLPVGPWVGDLEREELRNFQMHKDPILMGSQQPMRLIGHSEKFDVEGFEQWVQGVKRKSASPLYTYNGHQSDDDYIPVYQNTSVTNGLHFDHDGCQLAALQTYNPEASFSMDPRECDPEMTELFLNPLSSPVLSAASDDTSDDDSMSMVSSVSSSMDINFPSPSESTLGKRKILPLPKWASEGVSVVHHQPNTRPTKSDNRPELVLSLSKRTKISPPKTSPIPKTRRNSSSRRLYSSSGRLLGPSTRANPDSERVVLNLEPISRSPKVAYKPETLKYQRCTTVLSDTSDTSASESDRAANGTFQCYARFCQRRLETLDQVKDHFRSEHLPGTNFLRCAYVDCPHTSGSIGDMGRHELALAHKKPSFVCLAPSCSKAFTRMDALKRHWARFSAHESQSRRVEKLRS